MDRGLLLLRKDKDNATWGLLVGPPMCEKKETCSFTIEDLYELGEIINKIKEQNNAG